MTKLYTCRFYGQSPHLKHPLFLLQHTGVTLTHLHSKSVSCLTLTAVRLDTGITMQQSSTSVKCTEHSSAFTCETHPMKPGKNAFQMKVIYTKKKLSLFNLMPTCVTFFSGLSSISIHPSEIHVAIHKQYQWLSKC